MSDVPPSSPDERPTGWDRYLPPPPAADLTTYLRANSGRYTREALDQRMLAAGHPADAIAAAWHEIDAEDEAAGRRDRRGQTAAIIGSAYVLTWLLIVFLAIAPRNAGPYAPPVLLAGILAVTLFVPGILAVALARGTGWLRRASVGKVVAFALVPMLILFAIAGTCVAAVQQMQV